MSVGLLLLVVAMVADTVVVGVLQPTAQDGVVVGAQLGGVAIMALAMVTLMRLVTTHHQWYMQLHRNPWCWLLNPNPRFGITASRVVSISLMYKVAHQAGRLSQQCHPLVHPAILRLGVLSINEIKR